MYINNSQKFLDITPRQVINYFRSMFLNKKTTRLPNFSKLDSIFVLSTGRVGSQTVAALSGLSKNYLVYHEPKPLLFGLSKLAYKKYSHETSEIFSESFLSTRVHLLKHCQDVQKNYMETDPQVTFLAPAISQVLPGARFIHLVRDPRYVVRSGMRRQWYNGHPFDKSRIVPAEKTTARTNWNNYSPFEMNLWVWEETNKWILNFSKNISKDKVLLLHSEDIFNAHKETLLKLFNFMDSELPTDSELMRVLRKQLNIQKTGEFPHPRDWSKQMNQKLIKIVGKTAQTLGYEL